MGGGTVRIAWKTSVAWALLRSTCASHRRLASRSSNRLIARAQCRETCDDRKQRWRDKQRLGYEPLLKRRPERDVGIVDVPPLRFDDFRLFTACQLPAVDRVSLLR